MRAMLLDGPGRPLRAADVPEPVPEPGQVLLRVRACGVCRTDLHIADGELQAAPLLCAGLIGYRALRMTGEGERLGLYGFGAAAPEPLDAAIIFAPAGELVPAALRALDKGGVVVCAGIHMSDIPSFPYKDLWEERVLRSVANLTRQDGEAFLALAPRIPVRTEVQPYPLGSANEALSALREGRVRGAAALVVG